MVSGGRRLSEGLGLRPGGELRAVLGVRQESLKIVGVLTSGGEEDDRIVGGYRVLRLLGRGSRADVYLGRGQAILAERERIKKQTLTQRRLQHHAAAA